MAKRKVKNFYKKREPSTEFINPKDFDKTPASGPQFVRAFSSGRFYIKAYDKYFGNVVLSPDQLYLGTEQVYELNHAALAPVDESEVPKKIKQELLAAAEEAGLEWL